MKKEKEMSFINHLEELRWHIIRSLGAILIFAIIAFLSKVNSIILPVSSEKLTLAKKCLHRAKKIDQELTSQTNFLLISN